MSANVRYLAPAALTFLVSLGALGCSAPVDSEEDAAQVESKASLVFDASGARATGELHAGDQVTVSYDANRLTKCRGDKNGGPGWTIAGHYKIGDSSVETFWVAGHSPDGSTKTPTITLTKPGELEVWFENTSVFGCQAFDSDFGKNFHFTVQGTTSQATLRFGKTGAPTLTGTLKAPGTLTVEYDEARLSTCRGTQAGVAQWSITGNASVNGKKATTFSVAGLNAGKTATVELTEAGSLALWFENTNRYGCREFDSNAGANYEFDVTR